VAFGKHWEWRGFGILPAALREGIESLPRKFADCQEVADEYLWAPGARVNVKLRLGDLKFKRLLESRGGLERWLEDEAENIPFPLGREVVERLARDLGVVLPPLEAPGPLAREDLLGLLARSQPPVRRLEVKKRRWQYEWRRAATQAPDSVPVTVELAEVLAPEPTFSIAVEHPDFEPVAEVRDALGLEAVLQRRSYLEALEVWARGESILTARGRPPGRR
jgi:hypothetical protein